jgi:translation initiation factor 2 alpha subunit (eIF-2alpha)
LTLQNVSTEVTGALERIDLKGQEQYITGKTSELEAQATANADLLRTTFEGFVPVNETQRQGLQTIQAALKDNQILANETTNVTAAVQQVTSSATTSQNINLQNVNQLLQLMNSYGAQLQRQGKEIEKLKGKYMLPTR